MKVYELVECLQPDREDGSWSTPMVSAQLSVPLQQVEE